jgi:hypothetical protein
VSGGWRAQDTSGGNRPAATGMSLRVRRAIWLTITLLVAVSVSVLLIRIFVGQLAPVRLVSVGMSANHPAFPARQVARTTAAAFGELHEKNQEQFSSKPDIADADLHGERLLNALIGQRGASDGQTLIVYLNGLGGLLIEENTPTAQLLTVDAEPDCLASSKGDQLVPVASLLRELANSTTEQVLILFDGYMSSSNWRAGILHRDFPAVLSSEAKAACEENPNLHVLCACSPGEMTSVMDEILPARYAMGHFAIEGLKGGADGWTMDRVTGATSPDGVKNSRVSVLELVAFLKDRVNDWSGDQLAVTQTVQYFGAALEEDSEIAQVTNDSIVDGLQEVTEGASTGDGENAGPDADEEESSSDKEGAELLKSDTEAESASTDKGASEDGATKSKSEDTTDADTKKQSETDSGNGKPKSQSADSSADVAVAELKSKIEAFSQTLDVAWAERDRLRESSQPAIHSPREWRRLNYLLVRVQEQIRLGEDESVEREFNRIRELKSSIVRRDQTRLAAFSGPIRTTSLAALAKIPAKANDTSPDSSIETAGPSDDAGAGAGPPDDAAAAQAAEMEALEALWPVISGGTAETEPVDAFRKLYEKSATIRSEFFKRVFQHALDSNLAAPGTFASVNALLEFCVPVSTSVGQEPVPAELVVLTRLCQVGATVSSETLADFAKLCRETLTLRQQFEAAVLAAEPVYDSVKPAAKEWRRQLVATERWLAMGPEGMSQTRLWLDRTTAIATEFQDVIFPVFEDAVRLRSELLCELPAYARWCATMPESGGASGRSRLKFLAGVLTEFQWNDEAYPAEVFKLVSRSHEKKLLRLLDLTRRICLQLDTRSADLEALRAIVGGNSDTFSTGNLTVLVSEASSLWENGEGSFREGLRNEFESLANDVASTSTRARVLAALDVPWIPLPLRKKLQSQLNVTTRDGFAAAKGVGEVAEDHGEWEAFWCLQTLCLRGFNTSETVSAWQKFQELAVAGNSEAMVKGVETGLHLTGLWNRLAAELDNYEALERSEDETSASQNWRLPFCAHPSDAIQPGAIDPVEARNTAVLAELATDRAGDWSRRQNGYENLTGARQISLAWGGLTRGLSDPAEPAQFGDVPRTISLLTPAGSRFDVPIQTGNEQERPVNLVFESEIVKTAENGQPVAASGIPLDPAVRNQTRTVQVSLPANAPSRPQVLLVSLRDRQDGFPSDIRLVQVRPPLDASDWRIAFVTPAEAALISAIQSGEALPVGVRDRNLDHDKFPGDVNLRLPPNIAAADLKPILLPPLGTNVASVEIAVWNAGPDGQPAGNPLTVFSNVKVAESGRSVLLELSDPPPAAPATSPPAGTTPPGVPQVDVTGGLIFEVRIPSEQPIRHVIRPTVRDARDLATIEDVEFRDGLLTVDLSRSGSISDPLISDELPVSLSLPENLTRLNPTQTQLEGMISPTTTVRLSARFTDISEIERREFPLFVSVAGVPHAFAWYVRHQAQERPLNAELRIEAPLDGKTFQQGEAVRVMLGVYSRELEQSLGQGRWQIECRDQPVGLLGQPRKQILEVKREHAHRVSLTLVEGVWRFQTQSQNHSIEIPTAGRMGVFEVRVRLVPPLGPIRGAFEKKLTFGVDDKIKPPFMPVLANVPGLVRKGKIVQFLMNGQNLNLKVDVEDLEAGVREVLWGFDKDGDGKLGENEVLSRKALPELRSGKRLEQLLIPAVDLPEKEGRAVLLVSASDGLGTLCRQPLAVELEFMLPVELSTLVLKLQNLTGARKIKMGKIVVKGADGKSQVVDRERLAGTITLKIIPGVYTITAGNKTFDDKAAVQKGVPTEYVIDASAF